MRTRAFFSVSSRQPVPHCCETPVKLALLADLHSNIEAVDACIEHARQQRVERFVFLGDLVGYNADPAAVIERVREHVGSGAVVVKGNHDAAAAGDSADWMNPPAATAIRWTRTQLTADQTAFLANLPLLVREEDRLFVHGSAASPQRWGYVYDSLAAAASMDATDAAYVFCGHVHEAALYYQGSDRRPQRFEPVPGMPIPVGRHRRWLSIVGACGQPRDGHSAAGYALFDTELAMLTYHRVPYDYEAAARKVRAAGLPEEFARRLETGA
jgi:diadenosine tetraphosphatase ApaH/serine/threonine PP2A family protein phosphatase